METSEIRVFETESVVFYIEFIPKSAGFILKVFFQTFIENIFPAVHGCNCSEWKSICIFCTLFRRQPRTLNTCRSRTADTNRDTDLEATPRPAKDGLRASLCQETRLAHCHTGEILALLLYKYYSSTNMRDFHMHTATQVRPFTYPLVLVYTAALIEILDTILHHKYASNIVIICELVVIIIIVWII